MDVQKATISVPAAETHTEAEAGLDGVEVELPAEMDIGNAIVVLAEDLPERSGRANLTCMADEMT
jgi:hypothetical protein